MRIASSLSIVPLLCLAFLSSSRFAWSQDDDDPLSLQVSEMLEQARAEIREFREGGGEDDGADHPGREWAAALWKLREEHPGTPGAARATTESIHFLLHAGRGEQAVAKALALDADDGAWPELAEILWEAAELDENYDAFIAKAESLLTVRDEPAQLSRLRFSLAQAHWVEGDAERARTLLHELDAEALESEFAWRTAAALYEIDHCDTPPTNPAARPLRSGRDLWQRPARVMDLLAIGAGSTLADVGSGKGYFTLRAAARVGASGSVLAVDIEEDALDALRSRAEERELAWVETILGTTDDPQLPAASVDALLVVDTYHEMTAYESMLQGMYRALRPGGRLGILDTPGELGFDREQYHTSHDIPAELVISEALAAGFRLQHYEHEFAADPRARTYYILVFEKTED